MNKKNFFGTTCALLLVGCTHLNDHSPLKIETLEQAKTATLEARLAYLECHFDGGRNRSCQQKAWDTYGAPVIPEKYQRSFEQRKTYALTWIDSMEELAAAHVLRQEGYDCPNAWNVTDMLFHGGLSVTCENHIEYQLKRDGDRWRIHILSQPESEEERRKQNPLKTE